MFNEPKRSSDARIIELYRSALYVYTYIILSDRKSSVDKLRNGFIERS